MRNFNLMAFRKPSKILKLIHMGDFAQANFVINKMDQTTVSQDENEPRQRIEKSWKISFLQIWTSLLS